VHASTLERDDDFPRFLFDACAVAAVEPSRLILELIEQQRFWDEARFLRTLVQLRRAVSGLRPQKREPFLQLQMFPGEQGQVDWAHFGHVMVGRAKRALSCFVMTLSYSRALYLEFFFDQTMENFLRGHVHAFEFWSGQPRVILYDNLKSAVLERRGNQILFHPRLIELSAHYHFAPRPCQVRAGNQKGRVERAIRYVRDSFWAGRTFTTLAECNRQALLWRDQVAHQRRWPGGDHRTVAEAFAEEQPRLLPPALHPFATDRIEPVHSNKTIYVRFDLNDYSIPHTKVQRLLTVLADPNEVRIVDGAQVLVCHRRSYDKGAQIEDAAHVQALVEHKRAARRHRGTDHLAKVAPESQTLLLRAAERGDNLGTITAALLRLLERYGAAELDAAIREAIARGVPHPNAVRLALDHRRELRNEAPPVAVILPDHVKARDAHVQPHRLEPYDQLKEQGDE